jgi:hypothetical protein
MFESMAWPLQDHFFPVTTQQMRFVEIAWGSLKESVCFGEGVL